MSRIAERLRKQAQRFDDGYWDRLEAASLLRKSADEIESIRSDLDAQFRDMMDARDTAERKANENLIAYNRLQEDHGPGLGKRVRELEAEIKLLEGVAIMDGCRSAG
jgi:hypothetical protein